MFICLCFPYFQVQDSFPFSVGFSSDNGPINTPSNELLFPKGQVFPSVKVLTLRRENSFHLEAFYASHNEVASGSPSRISSFTVCYLSGFLLIGSTLRLKRSEYALDGYATIRLYILYGILSLLCNAFVDWSFSNFQWRSSTCQSKSSAKSPRDCHHRFCLCEYNLISTQIL